MSTSNEDYIVIIEPYAQRHYCKDFLKKFPGWEITLSGLQQTLARFNFSILSGTTDLIKENCDKGIVLYKFKFRIAGQNESAKSSGNRLIFVVNHKERVIRVLLVYTKNNVEGDRETDWWLKLVYDQYDGLP